MRLQRVLQLSLGEPIVFVFVDWETRSELDVKKVSYKAYFEHPSTEPICLGWAIEDDPVQVTPFVTPENLELFPFEAKTQTTKDLRPLLGALRKGACLVAHNAAFDAAGWNSFAVSCGLPLMPIQRWYCSAAASRYYGGPGALADAGEFWDLSTTKLESKAVNQWVKNPGHANKWVEGARLMDELFGYCVRDVETCRELFKKCPRPSQKERRVWLLDQKINATGIPVDLDLVRECATMHTALVEQANAEMYRVTSGAIKTARQRDVILKQLRVWGVEIDNLQAETVAQLLDQPNLEPRVRKVLEARQLGAGAASSKYEALLNRSDTDSRLRDSYIYYGGRPGRWTGVDVQPHNFIRAPKEFKPKSAPGLLAQLADAAARGNFKPALLWGDAREVLGALLRPTLCAPPGRMLLSLDFGQIEARKAAWFGGETELLDQFRNGVDVYTVFAKKINPTSPDRRLGKVSVLALNFGMWADTFYARCQSQGLEVDLETCGTTVRIYRATYHKIVAFWSQIEEAIITALENPGQMTSPYASNAEMRYVASRPKLVFKVNKAGCLIVRLPSGRFLFYHHIERADRGFEYRSFLRKGRRSVPATIRTWGSRLFENFVQASASDVFREAMLRIDGEIPEADIVAHTHDDIMLECNEADADRIFSEFERLALVVPDWAEGLPLKVDGWKGKRKC